MEDSATYVDALKHGLRRPQAYPHPVREVRVVETHISLLALTGDYAYKLKKPVRFNFVDYSTLELREHYCREELRLNRRLAPELYLDVVPVMGPPDACQFDGQGAPCDYAVRMRQFDDSAHLETALAEGRVGDAQFERLGTELADFHASLAGFAAPAGTGAPRQISRNTSDVFDLLRQHAPAAFQARIAALDVWRRGQEQRLGSEFEQRLRNGFVRECHGDLHLGNLILRDARIVAFDGIEFNDALRWIDILSEAAFLMMDLAANGRDDLAYAFINAYLERSGDYDGLLALPYYLTYRAAVRSMVSFLRAAQEEQAAAKAAAEMTAKRYLEEAERCTATRKPALTITHGVSGSGKSFASAAFVRRERAIRVRSDVERKRLAGLRADERGDAELYSAQVTDAVYVRLENLAAHIITAGFPVILDATFLHRAQRARFRALAERLGVQFHILDCDAEMETLRARVQQRNREARDASDADEDVLERQLREAEPLDEAERAACLTSSTAGKLVDEESADG